MSINVPMVFLIIFGILMFTPLCELYKILVVSPLPIKSHVILNRALVEILLEAGYEVTHVTPVIIKKYHPNLKQIDVSSNEVPAELLMTHSVSKINGKKKHFEKLVSDMFAGTLLHKSAHSLLTDSTQTFHLVIAEWLFNDLFAGLAALYDCPFIWFASMEPHRLMLSLIDKNHVSPLSKDSYESATFEKIFKPLMEKSGKRFLRYEQLRSVASLVFVNSQYDLSHDVRWAKKLIPIAGFHINQSQTPLPKHLKSVMDNAKNGVIYFSMGAYMDSADIPEDLIEEIVEMFGKLKQTVIWKLNTKLFDLPNNIHVLRWTPQQSILAHPNCILFITHGGLLSKIESIHYGVPMIGIPVYGDQFINLESAVARGIAKKVETTHLLASDLKNAIKEVIYQPSYRQRVEQLSLLFYDRKTTPRQDLIFWVNSTIHASITQQTTIHDFIDDITINVKMVLATIISIFIIIIFKSCFIRFVMKDRTIKN